MLIKERKLWKGVGGASESAVEVANKAIQVLGGHGYCRDYTVTRCGCCGCGCGPGFRRFFSTEEERERLENYRDQLKKELVGVEERIKECECK